MTSLARVARWLSPKFRTLACQCLWHKILGYLGPTNALSGIISNFIPRKELKYRTVRLNTGHVTAIIIASEIWFRNYIEDIQLRVLLVYTYLELWYLAIRKISSNI